MHAQTHAHPHLTNTTHAFEAAAGAAITVLPASAAGVSGQRPAASPGGAHAQEPTAAVPAGHTQDRE